MPKPEPTPSNGLIDLFWRVAFRFGFPLARIWWRIRRPHHEGALVAIRVGEALLLLKSSYRSAWNFPGGSVHAGETPEIAARREMREEIDLPAETLAYAGSVTGVWDGRSDTVHFFELQLDAVPAIRLDNREIVGAHFVLPEEMQRFALTAPVAAYLRGEAR